jgi:hypothetical protein
VKRLDLWFHVFKLAWLKLFYFKDLMIKFGYKEQAVFGRNTTLHQKNDVVHKTFLKVCKVQSKMTVWLSDSFSSAI